MKARITPHLAACFCFVVAVGLALPAHATSIVILRSPDRIYIGADSRRLYRDPAATFEGSVCKIVPAGSFFFVASGLTYANDEQVADLGAEAGRNAQSIKSALELFRRRIREFLPQALAAAGQIEHTPDNPASSLVLEAAFIGMQGGASSVNVEWYRRSGPLSNAHLTTDRRTYGSRTPGHYDFIFLGKHRAIDDYLDGHFPSIHSDSEATAFITQMIDLEIADSPESTASPIDIVELDGSGTHWLRRKPVCG